MTKLSSALVLLLLSTSLAGLGGCVDLGEVHDSHGYAGSGGKADDGASTNPVPPGATATATVTDCGRSSAAFSPGWEALTVLFGANIVDNGRTVDCKVEVAYEFPAGWTFDLPHVDVRGYVSAEEGSGLAVNLAVRGGAASDVKAETLQGPTADDFLLRVDGGGSVVACGATSAHVTWSLKGSSVGAAESVYAAFDALDGEIDWRACD